MRLALFETKVSSNLFLSDGGDHPFSQGKSMDREQGWRKRKYDEMGVEGRGRGTDGDKGRVSLERKQEA